MKKILLTYLVLVGSLSASNFSPETFAVDVENSSVIICLAGIQHIKVKDTSYGRGFFSLSPLPDREKPNFFATCNEPNWTILKAI